MSKSGTKCLFQRISCIFDQMYDMNFRIYTAKLWYNKTFEVMFHINLFRSGTPCTIEIYLWLSTIAFYFNFNQNQVIFYHVEMFLKFLPETSNNRNCNNTHSFNCSLYRENVSIEKNEWIKVSFTIIHLIVCLQIDLS